MPYEGGLRSAEIEAETRRKDAEIGGKSVDISYVIIGLCTLSIYLVAQGQLNTVDQKLVPRGDAFTSSIFLYEILNKSYESFGSAFRYIVELGNFIWLQHLLVLALSPLLYKQRGSLIFINYLVFFISSVVVFRTALLCGVSRFWAFIVTLLLAAMPWNFQALMTFNLASLMPEPILVGASLCAIILLCWLIAYPYSKKTAIAAGFALGAAIWSRGNAFLYLAMPLAGFALAILLRFIWPKWRLDIRVVAGFAIVALTCAAMAAIYFYFTHQSIYNYYSGDAAAALFNYRRKLAGCKWILLNMPGLAIAGKWYPPHLQETPYYAIALTAFGHLIAIYSAIAGVKKIVSERSSQVVIGALGTIGAATFYLYLLFALLTFSAWYSEVEIRILHPFEPALTGLICCALSILCGLFSQHAMPLLQREFSYISYVAVGALLALIGIGITKSSFESIMDSNTWAVTGFKQLLANVSRCRQLNEIDDAYLPSEDVRRLSLLLGEETKDKLVYFFWYGIFNFQITQYYAAQSNVEPPREVPHRSDNDRLVWLHTFNPELLSPEPSFRKFLGYVLASSDFVVIPERLEALETLWPSPMVAYRNDIAAAVNSPDIAPDYRVWAIIDERPYTRVLILKKEDPQAPDSGLELFPRTWATAAQVIGRGFKGALVVGQKAWWQADANALPRLLYAYENYNVVRVGQLYIGAAHAMGPANINAILTNTVPRPPFDQFIIAHDAGRLHAAIDACTRDLSNATSPERAFAPNPFTP